MPGAGLRKVADPEEAPAGTEMVAELGDESFNQLHDIADQKLLQHGLVRFGKLGQDPAPEVLPRGGEAHFNAGKAGIGFEDAAGEG